MRFIIRASRACLRHPLLAGFAPFSFFRYCCWRRRPLARTGTGAEEQLATKIVAVTGPRTMAVEVVNRSSLNAASADDIRRGLLTELASKGARFVTAEQAAARVRVSLSEDLQSYVWVAEIRLSASEQFRGDDFPAASGNTCGRSHKPGRWRCTRLSLWSQPERILDVAVLEGNPARLLVLDSNGVTSYRLQDGRWQAGAVSADHAFQALASRPERKAGAAQGSSV